MSEYLGCGNHSCRIEKPKGMGTNAGCSCLEGLPFEQRVKILKAFDRDRKRAYQAEAIAKAAYDTTKKITMERDAALARAEESEKQVRMRTNLLHHNINRAEKAEAELETVKHDLECYWTTAEDLEKQLRQVKDERDWLANVLALRTKGYDCNGQYWEVCKEEWLESAQEAAKRGEKI